MWIIYTNSLIVTNIQIVTINLHIITIIQISLYFHLLVQRISLFAFCHNGIKYY